MSRSLKRWSCAVGLVLAAYLLSGFYVVKGNERSAVRRFGQALRTESGAVLLKKSGLRYDLPWPWTEVSRVSLSEVRMLTIGRSAVDDIEASAFLQAVDPAYQSQFLTGDKNILNVQINVHYRVSAESVDDYLFSSESPERRLRLLAEAALSDVVLRSGVDFVHTIGRNELRRMLIQRTQSLAGEHLLGLVVDDVTIGGIFPPIRVKAAFLDVTNARAEKEKYIHDANAYKVQLLETASAEAQKINDEANIFRQNTVEESRGEAHRFVKLIERFEIDEAKGIQSRAAARQMAMNRRYVETMEEIFRKVAGKVFVDSGKPVDLTIFRDPKE